MAGVENVKLDQLEINEVKEFSNGEVSNAFYKNNDEIPTILIEKDKTKTKQYEKATTNNISIDKQSVIKATIVKNEESIKVIDDKVRICFVNLLISVCYEFIKLINLLCQNFKVLILLL